MTWSHELWPGELYLFRGYTGVKVDRKHQGCHGWVIVLARESDQTWPNRYRPHSL